MESLLCDEVWLSDPATPKHSDLDKDRSYHYCPFYTTKEDREQTIIIFLEKELSCMPESGYVKSLQSRNLIHFRFRAMQWLIKSGSRLNLSCGSVFDAANYFDRFLSMNRYHGWKVWMIELLSVASLSVASKFSETSFPLLHQIQMEDLHYSFQSSTIRRMELTLLQALGWRLGCVTSYSYVELLVSNLDSIESAHRTELTARVTELLLGALLDIELQEFPPSVVALSALSCCLEELIIPSIHAHLAYITRLFNVHNQKIEDHVVKCQRIMKSRLIDRSPVLTSRRRQQGPQLQLQLQPRPYHWPSSPVTVLLKERIDIYDYQVDLSIFNMLESCPKRRKT